MANLITPKLASVSSIDTRLNTGDVIHEIDTPIPDGIPDPMLWRVAAMPVRQRRVTKGGIMLPDESLDVQEWTHGLVKICKVGPLVYRGKAYEGLDVKDEDIPKPGDLYIIDPKHPRRYVFKGITVLVLNDDALHSRVDPSSVESLKFNGLNL